MRGGVAPLGGPVNPALGALEGHAYQAGVGPLSPGDLVLIAGKGHEDYQIVGAERRHLADREEARRALEGGDRAFGRELLEDPGHLEDGRGGADLGAGVAAHAVVEIYEHYLF